MKGPLVEDEAITAALRSCQAGDMGGLTTLIAHFQRPAQQFAMLLTGDQALAEDIVQDTFLQAYRSIGRFQIGRPFAPWLYRILTNIARHRRRAAVMRREVSLNLMLEHGAEADIATVAARQPLPDPAEQVEHDEVRRAMLAALSELTPLLREVVVLRYYFGYADAEIAEIVRCRPATARKRLQNGLRALRHIIHEHFSWLLVDTGSSLFITLPQEGIPHGTA
jgi:RNA polymerase sigma-70 factor, ECF subfamily